jgi:hypothetical protein
MAGEDRVGGFLDGAIEVEGGPDNELFHQRRE